MEKKPFTDNSDTEQNSFTETIAEIMLGDLVPREKTNELSEKTPKQTKTKKPPQK